MNFSRLSRFTFAAALAILATIAASMVFAISASNLQTQLPTESASVATEIKSGSITTSNREKTLQKVPELMEEVVDNLNEANTAEIFKESGLLEKANVGFELRITPKNSLAIDNSNPQIEGSQVASSPSTLRSCWQLCDPCPSDPSVACWVRHECGTPLHT